MALDPNFAIYAQQQPTDIPLIAGVSGYPSEEHRFDLSTTNHPVESGSSLSDNAVRRQEKLRLEGRVTDLLPRPESGGLPPPDRAPDVWNRIAALFKERVSVTVITNLRVYRNMLITRATAPVDRSTGRSLKFTLELTEVLFATAEIARFPPAAVDPTGPAADRTSQVDGGDRNAPTITITVPALF